jgi:ATP adenylyltransferase
LDRLWSPWRAKYVASGIDSQSPSCVFCRLAEDSKNDESNLVVFRGIHNFVALNLYPYITGHLLIVPYQHLAELDSAAKEITDELMDLTKRSETALRKVYSPAGFNVGMNLGGAAGAGIVDHIHLHILPRWPGDTNFMTTIAESRVIPESLETTYSKLRGKF